MVIGDVKPPAEDVKRVKGQFRYLFDCQDYIQRKKMWLSIRDRQLPFLGDFLDTEDMTSPGRKRDVKALDGEAWRCNLIFAGGMRSGLTPQTIPWFDFAFESSVMGDDHAAKTVLDERREILLRVLAGSNFYNATHSNYTELAFGQAAVGVFEDAARGLYYETYPIGCYAYDVDDKGMPCCFAVRKRMTAIQIRERFGGKIPERVDEAIKNNRGYEASFDVCWLVKGNPEADAGKIASWAKRYVSYYWVEGCGEDGFMTVGGFDEFPVAVARYQVIGTQAYGIGPGWYADGDNRMLYKLLKEAYINTEMFSRPPLQAPGDFFVDYRPGSVTRNLNTQAKVETLFRSEAVFPQLFEISDRKKDDIRKAYNTDLFAMLNSDPMDKTGRTAFEISLRNQEKMQLLGPVIERQNSEYLNLIIERSYSILERADVLPPFPDDVIDEMQGEGIKIEYQSPLAQAAKASQIQPIEGALNIIAQLSQFDPRIANLLDAVEAAYAYTESIGTPMKILRSKEDYEGILEAEAEAQRAQEEAATMAALAPAMRDMAQASRIAQNTQELASDGANPVAASILGSMGGGAL